ncbi:MAG: uracil-DNA glycosylase [Rhodobacter sp.]|nr:uracil-DNA glycosylase [Rhodobacter sp.]
MESGLGYHDARALLEWQVELGVNEAIGEVPVNRYEVPAEAPKLKVAPAPAPAPVPVAAVAAPVAEDAVAAATAAAAGAGDLAALRAAIEGFGHCELTRGAKTTVFADGNPGARVMMIGEAPGRDEDIAGRPFVGRAGQLLDRMLAAIDLGRDVPDAMKSVYITNILPWRPPQNRDPLPAEIAMMLPFVARHVELVDPDVLVLMGNISCLALLGRKGISRLRGNWVQVLGKPALPMFHPAFLLRTPSAKREAWHDLLMLQARLREAG